MRRLTVIGALAVLTLAAAAQDLPPPELEARMRAITAELRCLVCQNQTIADSNAGLAVDLRREVLGLLRNGASDDEVRQYMTRRYGDFVLYRPPLQPSTWLLWAAPALLVAGGSAALVLTLRRRARLPDAQFDPEPDAQEAA